MALNNRAFWRVATRFNRLLVKLSVLQFYNSPPTPMMVIQLPSGFTGDAFEIWDSSGNILYKIGPDGRPAVNGKQSTIAGGSATSLANVAIPASGMVGGTFMYTVRVSDGTDFQSLAGIVTYAAVNKAGALTLTITDVAANGAKAVSAGTLTLAWTFVAGTNLGTIKLQPTSSLTATTYDVTLTFMPQLGAVTVL